MRHPVAIRRHYASALLVGAVILAACQDGDELMPPDDPSPVIAESDLVTIVDIPRSDLDDRQRNYLSEIESADYVIETYIGRLATNIRSILLSAETIGVEVSPTEYYVATLVHVEEDEFVDDSAGRVVNILWSGELPDTFGELNVTLSPADDRMIGDLADYANGASYDIQSLGDGLAVLIRNDPTKFGPIDSRLITEAVRLP